MTNLTPIVYKSIKAVYVVCMTSYWLLLPFPPQYLYVVWNHQSRPKHRLQHVLEARMLSSYNVLCPVSRWGVCVCVPVMLLMSVWFMTVVRAPSLCTGSLYALLPPPPVCCKVVMCLLESSRCAEGREKKKEDALQRVDVLTRGVQVTPVLAPVLFSAY